MWVLAHLTSAARRTDGGLCPVARAGFFVPWRPLAPLVARPTDPGRAAGRRDGVRCTRHMVGICRSIFGHGGRRPPAQQPYRYVARSAVRESIRSLLQEHGHAADRPWVRMRASVMLAHSSGHRSTCTRVARITRSLEDTYSNKPTAHRRITPRRRAS